MDQPGIDQIVNYATAGQMPRHADTPAIDRGTPFIVIPQSFKVENLEKTLPQPSRIRQTVQALDVASFIAYINRFSGPNSLIFANLTDTAASLLAVLDYHEDADNPSWNTHCVAYGCPLSKEWRTWIAADKTWFTQENFAHFIETNQLDITNPPGAAMLEIANTLEAATHIKFASAVRLSDGTKRLLWAEDTVSKAGENATLDVPKQITIGVRPFVNGQGYTISAHLRHRVANGAVSFSYELIRPHKAIEDATTIVMEQVEKETKIKPLLATI